MLIYLKFFDLEKKIFHSSTVRVDLEKSSTYSEAQEDILLTKTSLRVFGCGG